jgi:PAS domain S-box-containing protein
MLEFSKSLWAIDSIATIGQILRTDHGLERFREFASSMEGHGCDVDLNFIHDAERIRDLPEDQREVAASKLIAAGKVKVAAGAVADESTSQATRALWDGVMTAEQEAQLSKESEETTAFEIVSIESDRLKKLLAMDAFPRFTKSRACNRLMADLKLKGGDALLGAISDAGGSAPPDADAWLNMFVSIAESYPACIVISDMTIPGCPMVYINNEFSRVTGYSREDVVGRNCRFLQGPDSEPESVHVIRSTLSQAKESHVLITNYRKNGEKFQNLLSMKPVFDADGVYRFVIGVQFEVIKDKNLKRRMIQLDKLLRMLPTQLGVASDEEAALRGELAARPDGTANLKVKEASKLARLRLGSRLSRPYKTTGAHGRPKKRFQMRWWGAGATNGPTLDFTASMVAFTKSMWLSEPVGALQHLLLDPLGFDAFEAHLQKRGSELSRTHLRFWQEAYAIDNAGGDEEDQLREMRVMHRRMEQNALFYCTTNEITIGNLGKTFWPAIANEMSRCQQQSVEFLAGKPLSSFLDSPDCISYIRSVRDRERGKVSLPVRTAAYGLDDSPSADPDAVWLGMFRAMAGTVRFGVVATDMNCPGLPLAVVNGGFELVTGVDPSQAEGRNCRFITGPKSEGYITDEIMDSLRHAKPLFTKLHNYKASGEAFQCVVTLNPVHTPGGAYKFMVGTQVDFDPEDQMVPKMLIDLERITRLIPQTTTGAPPEHLAQSIKEMDQYLTATTTTTA